VDGKGQFYLSFLQVSKFATILLFLLLCLVVLITSSAVDGQAAELGSVLILNADCSNSECTVGSYGAGFIVKVEQDKNTAYVLTALHVVSGADKLFVLYDPSYFPRDYVADL